jgi:hypothetical protein
MAFAHLAHAAWSLGVGRFDETLEWLDQAAAALDQDKGEIPVVEALRARALLLATRGWTLAMRGDVAAQDLMPAAQAAAGLTQEDFQLHALAVPVIFHAFRGEVTAMLEARREFLERCSRLRGSWLEALVYPTTTRWMVEAGLYARARDELRAFEAVMPAGPLRAAWLALLGGLLDAHTGDLDGGVRGLDEALRVADMAAVDATQWALDGQYWAAQILLDAGRLEAAAERASNILGRVAQPGARNPLQAVRARRLLATIDLRAGVLDRARRHLHQASAGARDLDNPGERARCLLVSAELTAGEGDEAAALGEAQVAERQLLALGLGRHAERAGALRRTLSQDATGPSPAGGEPGEPDTLLDPQHSRSTVQRG